MWTVFGGEQNGVIYHIKWDSIFFYLWTAKNHRIITQWSNEKRYQVFGMIDNRLYWINIISWLIGRAALLQNPCIDFDFVGHG